MSQASEYIGKDIICNNMIEIVLICKWGYVCKNGFYVECFWAVRSIYIIQKLCQWVHCIDKEWFM